MPKGNPLIRPETKWEWLEWKKMYWQLRELYKYNLNEYYTIKAGMRKDGFAMGIFKAIERKEKFNTDS